MGTGEQIKLFQRNKETGPPPPHTHTWECAGSKANLVSFMRTAKALASLHI